MVVDVVNHPSLQNLKNEMSKQKAFVNHFGFSIRLIKD
jgi:hypothetical protein